VEINALPARKFDVAKLHYPRYVETLGIPVKANIDSGGKANGIPEGR
jgi:hypothetical protein